jgi:hypothetical protein
MPKLLKIVPSHLPEKKLDAVFQMDSGRTKTVPFGARGMDDFTITKDKEQKERYRARHKGDTLTNPLSPGALSWYVLWSAPTREGGIRNFKARFGV